MDCSRSNSIRIKRLWHKTRVLVQKGKNMTEGGGTSPLPSPGVDAVPAAVTPLNRAQPAVCGSSAAKQAQTISNAQSSNRLSLDPKRSQYNQAGLDISRSDTSSQDKVTPVQRPSSLVTDSVSIVTKQRSTSHSSEPSSNTCETKNMELISTRSGSTSSYGMVSGIAGRRVDSGYHSVGGGDQILRSAEEERKAPIAEITEFSLTPEEGSEAPTPEFIFTSATPPSLPQSPLVVEVNCENSHPLEAKPNSTKPKPANLNLVDTEDSVEPKKGRGLVSSHDSLSPRRLRPKNLRRKHTVSGVTEEARVVLEQLLRRSYSHNDASPRNTLQNEYVGISEMTVIEETPKGTRKTPDDDDDDDDKPLRSPRSPMARNKSYQAATGHISGPPPKSDSFDFMCYDDDDLTSHSPVSKTNSIISGSSRSSSFKQRYVVRPLPTEDVEAALKGNLRKKTKIKRRPRKNSAGSTSSDSDIGAFDTNSGTRRKKSFLKRASERLRQSFRISKARHRDLDDPSDDEKTKVEHKKRKSPKNRKGGGSGFKKSPSDPSAGDEIIHTHVHKHIHQEQNKTENGVVVLHTEDIDVIQENDRDDHHVEVKLRTKESWPKEKEKKSLWDNILQKIRKSGHKLQRKRSTKGKAPHLQQRSTSADALQYVSINQNDNAGETLSQGGDRRRRITQSFREIFGGDRRKSYSLETRQGVASSSSNTNAPMIVRPALPPLPHLPPPPAPSESGYFVADGPGDAGRHDLRQRMRLDGLIAAQPNVPGGVGSYDANIDVDRYDRLIHTREGDRLVPVGLVQQQNVYFPDSFDDVDNTVSPEFRQAIQDGCDKPFELKTDTEKEELYEKIAEQLAMIADSYDFNAKFANGPAGPPPSKTASLFVPAPTPATAAVTPDEVFSSSVDPQSFTGPGALSPPEVVIDSGSLQSDSGAQSPAVEGAIGGLTSGNLLKPSSSLPLNHEARRAHSIERRIGAILRDKGDKHQGDIPDIQPIVAELVRSGSTNNFYKLLTSNLGQEPGWQQLAVMFKLTQSAVQLVGMGTAAALQIKELSLQYFEDKFAGWIVGQGGWESMVSDTDLSSEVD